MKNYLIKFSTAFGTDCDVVCAANADCAVATYLTAGLLDGIELPSSRGYSLSVEEVD